MKAFINLIICRSFVIAKCFPCCAEKLVSWIKFLIFVHLSFIVAILEAKQEFAVIALVKVISLFWICWKDRFPLLEVCNYSLVMP